MTPDTVIRNMDQLFSERSTLNGKLEEISAFACPEKSCDFFSGYSDRREGDDGKPRVIVIDNVSEANSIFARGMFANLCPPGVQYFQFALADERLGEREDVRNFMAAAGVAFFRMLGASNFAAETSEAFEDLGWAGIMNVAAEEGFDGTIFRFRNYHLSEYYISENGSKVVDTVYRQFRLTARQIVETYNQSGDAIPQKIREDGESDEISRSARKYTLIHVVFPNKDLKLNEEGVPLSGNNNKPWKSITVCREEKAMIRDSGFDYLPYTVARFEKKAKSVYGFSPGLRILRTAKILNQAMRTVMRAGQKQADPPKSLDMAAYSKGISPVYFDHPGAVNFYDSGSGANPPQFAPVPTQLVITDQLIQKWEMSIDSAYFVNLFNMLQQLAENTKNDRTKFEIMQLVNEKQTLVIPIVAHIIEEYLTPLFLKSFGIALRRGAFGQLPPSLAAYVKMYGFPAVKVDFNSPLALAAKMSQVSALYNAVSQIGMLADVDGGAGFDWLKLDKVVQFVLECGGIDPRFMRSEAEVQDIRAQRQQAAQQQMAEQQMAEIAKSQDLSKSPEDGSVASSAMAGLVGGIR